MSDRLSICYAAPGHALVTTSGSARNVLSLAEALSRWADVTVAFREIREPVRSPNFSVIAIEPGMKAGGYRNDDVAAAGFNALGHVSYLRELNRFSEQKAQSFDLILEKGWRMSGFLAASFSRRGVPAALIENDVRHWSESFRTLRGIIKYGVHHAAQLLASFHSRRVPLVIAETEELKTMIVEARGVASEKIKVVHLGVDHALFRPMPQAASRELFGVQPDAFVLLYVGGMDIYHDLFPVLDAFTRTNVPLVELHVVGDGGLRHAYEQTARNARMPIRFHGRVPHSKLAEFIAVADLCLAPYRVSAFPNETVCFSTLKIPEYMACARPVASVPSGNIKRLIEHEVSGFLFSNDTGSWVDFLSALPSWQRLKAMGEAAYSKAEYLTWERTAEGYLSACESLLTQKRTYATASTRAHRNPV